MQIIRLFISLAVLLTSFAVHAASIMSLVPSTTNVTVTPTGTATVDYTVTNTTVSGTLAGLAVDLSAAGGNPNGFQLQSDTCTGANLVPAASCTFQVVIVGAKQPVNFTLSPRVCANNNMACSQAIASNRPLVTVGSVTKAGSAYIAMANDEVLPINDLTQALGTPYTGFNFTSVPYVGTAVSPDGKTLYVSNVADSNVVVIDLTGANPPTAVSVPFPGGIAVAPDNATVYVASPPGIVTIIDAATLTTSTIPYAFSTPYAVTVSPDGSKVYVNDFIGMSGFIVTEVFDTSTYNLINTLGPLHGTVTPFNLPITTVSSDNVYVATSSPSDDLVVITDTDLNVAGPIVLAPGSIPTAVLFSQDVTRLYISLTGLPGGEIAILDINTGFLPNITGVGNQVNALSFNPSGTHLYAVPQSETYITVINTGDSSTIQTPIPASPLNFGVNPFVN